MREHKYRAWHKVEKRMYHVAILYPDAHTVMLQIGDTLFSASFAEIELLEYTGLKDKNGVEVFEGDIIAGRHAFCEYLIDVHRAVEYEHGTWNYSGASLANEPEEKWEIIGNVYETRDLVKDEEDGQEL